MAFNIEDIKKDVYRKYLRMIELYTKSGDPGVNPYKSWNEIGGLFANVKRIAEKYPEANVLSRKLDDMMRRVNLKRKLFGSSEEEWEAGKRLGKKPELKIKKALTLEEKEFEHTPSYEEWVAAGSPEDLEGFEAIGKIGLADIPRELAKEFAGGLTRGLEAAEPAMAGKVKFKTKAKIK